MQCPLPLLRLRAALEMLRQSGRQPDIIHCHEWQVGAAGGIEHGRSSGAAGVDGPRGVALPWLMP